LTRLASNEAIKAIWEWLDRPAWRGRYNEYFAACLDEVCAEADVEPEQLADLIGEDRSTQLEACIFEQFIGRPSGENGLTIADDYLKRRGWQRSAGAKRYLQALRDSLLSLWEVVGVTPGSHFEAVDLIRGGAPIQVWDVLGSKSVHQWDRLLARVMKIGDRHQMAGGTLLVEHDASQDLLDGLRAATKALNAELRKQTKHDGIDQELAPDFTLGLAQPLLIGCWLKSELEQALAPPPRLVNSDGEEIALCELSFPLRDPAATGRVTALLDADPRLAREASEEPHWSWFAPEPSGSRQLVDRKPQAEHGRTLVLATLDPRGTVLGGIRLQDAAVVLSVNSRSRADRGRTLIGSLLGVLVREPSTTIQPLDSEAMATRRESAPLPPSGLSPEEEAEMIRSFVHDHYRDVLSRPVGTLGGKTPRDAASSQSGRLQVAAWLKHLENQSSRAAATNPGMAYDFTWMWEELGIADQRR
jgi:hypothetical protein